MTPFRQTAQQEQSSYRGDIECAALLAGLWLLLLDLGWLSQGTAQPMTTQLALTSTVILFFASTLLAAITRGIMYMTARLTDGPWQRSLLGSLLALPIILPVSVLLFRGTGISTRWYAPYGPFLLVPLLLLLTGLGLRLVSIAGRALSGSAVRFLFVLLLLGAGGLCAWFDHTAYPHQYLYLHWVLLLLTTLCFLGAGWLVLPRSSAVVSWRYFTPGLLVLGALIFLFSSPFLLPSQQLQLAFGEHTYSGERLAAVARALLDFDGDHYSIILGGQDCDNFNAAIHPYAPEVADNGIDENCDGHDEQRVLQAVTAQKTFNEKTYRELLRRWRQEPELAAPLTRLKGFNVVLLLVDALRADQLLPSRSNQQQYPHLLRLLSGGVSFRQAFSTGAGTDIGMATLFTGQLDPFAKNNQTLMQAYQAAGFTTYGVFQREVERWVGRQFSFSGLSGRRVVVNDPLRRDIGTAVTSKQVTDHGIRFLKKQRGAPFFLWLHYFDVHEHHQIDPRQLKELAGREVKRGMPFYRAMIQHVDQQVGRFLEALELLGLRQRTIVILASDHGEGLAESPRLPSNHGDVLYNPLVHVPLSFTIPQLAGREVDFPVSLADLYPTLLDLSGISAPPCHGISLLPYLFHLHQEELQGFSHAILMYEARQRGIIIWPYKLLTWLDRGVVELYQLDHDYAEKWNLADENPARVQALTQELSQYQLIVIDRLTQRKK